MDIKQSEKIYVSPLFQKHDDIICGTTTKKFGPARRDIETMQRLSEIIGRGKNQCVTGEQTHGNTAATVLNNNIGKALPRADGLVYCVKNIHNTRQTCLCVYTADCVPVFFYDPVRLLIGICHAGYRGILGKIIKNMVNECRKNGSKASDLKVSLGPHIRACSYTVPESRARVFEQIYGKKSGVVAISDQTYRVSLSEAIRIDLLSMGVRSEQIDHDSSPCTYCDSDTFYSYRRRTTEEYGEMISFIGMQLYD
jgi:YfiH family protein